jgi:hypothetical protein
MTAQEFRPAFVIRVSSFVRHRGCIGVDDIAGRKLTGFQEMGRARTTRKLFYTMHYTGRAVPASNGSRPMFRIAATATNLIAATVVGPEGVESKLKTSEIWPFSNPTCAYRSHLKRFFNLNTPFYP